MTSPEPAHAQTSSWHAVPDAVGVARQLRLADLRGLPATLRYGATLSGVALAAARSRPRTVVLVDDDGGVTGSELESAIDGVASEMAALARASDGPPEVVVCCGGHVGFVAAVAAAGALGIDVVVVPPDAGNATLREVTASATVVVVDAATSDEIQALAPHAALLDARAAAHGLPGGSLRSVPRPRHRGVLTMLTSGTTSRPRATRRGPAAWGQMATVLSLLNALDLHRDEPVVVAPPLAHGHGLAVLTAALVAGARAVLAHGLAGAELLEAVSDQDAGVLAVLPTQLIGVLDAVEAEPGLLPRRLRRVATGSAPLPTTAVERSRALLGDVLIDFYGASEVGTVTVATSDDLREAPGTVGRPVAGVSVDVVDEAGAHVPTGVTGRVRVSSPWRAQSTADGNVDIGDLGHLDEQGRLFIDGRVDDVVIVGGHNVSLSRVRAWFQQQPGVAVVAVESVVHDRLGNELRVQITGDADLDELARRALAELGTAVAPRRVERA